MPKALQLDFAQSNLVGNVEYTACHIDTGLELPWGVALKSRHDCIKEIAVASYGSGSVYQFDSCGNVVGSTIYTLNPALTGPGHPTAVVYNHCCKGFPIASGGVSGPSCLIVADGNSGIISGYSDSVNTLYAIAAVGPTGIYTGLAIHKSVLYAANFANGTIDLYNSSWGYIGSYTDPTLAAIGYNPYNVAVIDYRGCKRLAVTFALYDSANPLGREFALPGVSSGFVDIFDFHGNYYRFTSQGPLNAPWGLFDVCINGKSYVGVGNNGDGRINFFDDHGNYVTQAHNESGSDLNLGGLFGVVSNPHKAVLYAAHGLVVTTPPATVAAPFYSGLFSRLTVV